MIGPQFGIFSIFFIIIIGMIIFAIVRGAAQWGYNNRQPVLSVAARVVAKRAHTSHHNNMVNDNMMHSSSTRYYTTFEVESGDRMELHIPANEYGMLVEDDYGRLTFQGSRFLGFDRQKTDLE